MTAPRIKVRVDVAPGVPPIIWYCDHGPTLGLCASGETYTISAAADAGREHLRQAHPEVVWAAGGSVYDKEAVMFAVLDEWAKDHPEEGDGGYSRSCGVHTASCEAQTCQCASVDLDALGGPENATQRLDCEGLVCGFHPCQCEDAAQRLDPPCDFPCCCDHPHCRAHGNPLQTAHNEGVRR